MSIRYEEDYVMRMIKEMIEVLARIVLHKKDSMHEMEFENKYAQGDSLLGRLISMADTGKINEAENMLYEGAETDRTEYLEAAFAFYYHINEYDDTFLEEHDYSREEIKEGLKCFLKEYGIEDTVFMRDLE